MAGGCSLIFQGASLNIKTNFYTSLSKIICVICVKYVFFHMFFNMSNIFLICQICVFSHPNTFQWEFTESQNAPRIKFRKLVLDFRV